MPNQRGHVPARPMYITPHIRFLFIAPQFRIEPSFRPRFATTPLPFSLPSALRKPSHRTYTDEVTRHTRRTRIAQGHTKGTSLRPEGANLSAGLGYFAGMARGFPLYCITVTIQAGFMDTEGISDLSHSAHSLYSPRSI